MKRLIPSNIAMLLTMVVALLCTSCIFVAPGDHFFRSLWKAQDSPAGKMTLEFLCNGYISVKAENADHEGYGTYESSGTTAVFNDLSLFFDGKRLDFKDAYRNKDILFLSLYESSSSELLTIQMIRLSAYED